VLNWRGLFRSCAGCWGSRFWGRRGTAAGIARVLFGILMVLFLLGLVLGLRVISAAIAGRIACFATDHRHSVVVLGIYDDSRRPLELSAVDQSRGTRTNANLLVC